MTKLCRRCNCIKDQSEFQAINSRRKYSYCPKCRAEITREFQAKHPEYSKGYHRNWQQNNKKHFNAYKRKYYQNPQVKIRQNHYIVARRIIRGIETNKPFKPFLNRVGLATKQEFIDHITSTVPSGYTIQDYGSSLQIDHIKPLSSFDLTKDKQLKEAFNYKNIRLISIVENQKKGPRV